MPIDTNVLYAAVAGVAIFIFCLVVARQCFRRRPRGLTRGSRLVSARGSEIQLEASETLSRRRAASNFIFRRSSAHKVTEQFDAKYKMVRRLAFGASGMTFLAKERNSGRMVVVKKPKKPNDVSDFQQLVDKTHPNVVRVFELFHKPNVETYIVMEYCAGGDLIGALEDVDRQIITESWCAIVFQQACCGVRYLHIVFRLVHNDLKPENILLDRRPSSSGTVPRVMIADFGAALLDKGRKGKNKGLLQHQSQSLKEILTSLPRGDPRYWSPEEVQGSDPIMASDVWSLGVVLFEMLSGGCLPFIYERNVPRFAAFCKHKEGASMRTIWTSLQNAAPVRFDLINSPGGKNLLEKILVPEKTRLGLDAVLGHFWLKEFTITYYSQRALPVDVIKTLGERAQQSKLQLTLLNLVVAQMQGKTIDLFRPMWYCFDKDGDGVLNRAEFAEMCAELALQAWRTSDCSSNAWEDVDRIFNNADVNGNGKIEFNEFCAMMFDDKLLDEGTRSEYIQSAFHHISDGQESVTMEQFLCTFGGEKKASVGALFDEMDQDHDGMISVRDFASYISGCEDLRSSVCCSAPSP